jgi:hypothetical protein
MYDIKFPPRSNRESWTFTGLLTDYDDEPIDLTGCSMVFSIMDIEGRHMIASTDNTKLTFPDTGVFQWNFTLQEMQCFCPGQCRTGLVLTNDDGTQTIQLSIGPLPIVAGVVPLT